jgi:hypothetical protein
MARLTTDLSARLWSDGICTRWMTIRGFAYLTNSSSSSKLFRTRCAVCSPPDWGILSVIAIVYNSYPFVKVFTAKNTPALRSNQLKPVDQGETGVCMLRELSRSYLPIVKDLSGVMNRLKPVVPQLGNSLRHAGLVMVSRLAGRDGDTPKTSPTGLVQTHQFHRHDYNSRRNGCI